MAHDFDALRKALGYEQWNLLGASYGTRYGMTFMQLYPESVRSAMFFGLRMKNTFYDRVPAGLAASLQKVFDECAADPNCQNAYPDLEADFYRLLDRIKEQPVEIEKFITEKFSESTHYYTQEMVLSTLFYMLYQKQGIEMIPAVIQQLANGNDWILQNLTAPSIKRMSGTKTDASLIISCVDDEPRPDYLSPYGNTSLAVKIRETFDGFPDDRIRYFFPVLSGERHFPEEQWQQLDIPTLLFSGALDPTTPPTNADSLLSNLSNARHYVIPGSGHTPQMDAALDFTAFIDDPKPEKDISTAMNIKPLQFVHQIVLNRGLAETFTKIQTGNYKPVFLPALALLLCVFGLLYFPIRFVIQKLRKKPAKEKIGLLLPVWLVAAVPLVLSFLLVKVVGETMASNPFLLSMGFAGESNFLEPGAVVLLIALLWSGWKVYKNPTLKIKTPVVISLAGGFLFLIFLPLMNFI